MHKLLNSSLTARPTNIKNLVIKSSTNEQVQRKLSEVFNFLTTTVQTVGTVDRAGHPIEELHLLHLIKNKKKWYEYVSDCIIKKSVSAGDCDSRIFLSIKEAVKKAETDFPINIKYVIVDHEFEFNRFKSSFKIILSPIVVINQFKDIPFYDLSDLNRSVSSICNQQVNRSVDNFGKNIDNLLSEIKVLNISNAVNKLLAFVVDCVDYVPAHVLNIIKDRVIAYLDGTLLLAVALEPTTKRTIIQISDDLADFRDKLERKFLDAVAEQQEINPKFADFGYYYGKHGQTFGSLNYNKNDFWLDALIIARHGYLATLALNLTNIPAVCNQVNVSYIVKQFDNKHFDELTIELYKILFLKNETSTVAL